MGAFKRGRIDAAMARRKEMAKQQRPSQGMAKKPKTADELFAGMSERLRIMGYRTYADYIASDHWADIRRRWRAKHPDARCERCGAERYQLHHLNYRRLGLEPTPGDIIPLCGECHTKEHHRLATTGPPNVSKPSNAVNGASAGQRG